MPSKTNRFKIKLKKSSHGEHDVGEWLNRKTLNDKRRRRKGTNIKEIIDTPKAVYKSWQSKERTQKMKRIRRAQLNPLLANSINTNRPRLVKPRKK